MVVEAKYPPKNCDQAKGLYGYTGFFGFARVGGLALGHGNDTAGVYRIYRGRSGLVNFRYPFYMQWAPRTANQKAASGDFADGMAAWAALTQEQKDEYNQKALKMRMHGVNLFMREWMFSR